MTEQFLVGDKIEKIIGEMNKQTPGKRYQVQMFLQNLLEYDSGAFLAAGIQMVESLQVRFYVKYVFYEILRQVFEPDEKIIEYIKQECIDERRGDYFVNNVVCGRHIYITILRNAGILDRWFSDEKKKNTVFVLLKSISQELNSEDIAFIKKYSFLNEEDDKQFRGCFGHDIINESDELFELRMLFYNKYPEWSQELYIDVRAMMKHCESRMIRLISFWLKNKIKSKGKSVYRYEEEIIAETDPYLLQEGKYILDELIQYIPLQSEDKLYYSDWSAKFLHHRGLERATVELLKKSNVAIIETDAEYFWKYYSPYMGKNYAIFNELILYGLRFLPESYSDKVVDYLTGDFDKKVFDYTSGLEDQLELVKRALKVHTAYCTKTCLNAFLEAVEKYVSPKSCEWYKWRMHHISRREDNKVKIDTFDFYNYLEDRRNYPDVIELKSMFDLATSILTYMRNNPETNWIVCEGSDDKTYLDCMFEDEDNLKILPVGGCGNVVKLFQLLYSPMTEKEEAQSISSKILFLIDTDVQFKQVNKPLELSGGKKNNIFIRRLQLDNGEIRLIDPTILNNTYAQTEIEDCLIPKIYYDSLVDVINVVGTEKEKEIMTKYAFVTDAKQSRLKGDNSCIVVTDISYVQKKQIIVDFAENSDNKYLIARKYAEKYKQSLDREPHKLQIAISRCFDI